MNFKPYPSYKDSGVKWLGEMPRDWSIFKSNKIFKQSNTRSYSDDEQLTASQKYGVIPQSLYMRKEASRVVLALSGTGNFKHVDKNDFVISLRSFQGGIELCLYNGCVSPAYTVLKPNQKICHNFWSYLFKSTSYITVLNTAVDGIREGKTISYENFGKIYLSIPSLSEQTQIANFLDQETTKIDKLIAKQEQLIELLEEQRKSVISHAVTKGLDPNVPMKDSGVEWLGEVPENYNFDRLDGIIKIVRGNSTFSKGDLLDKGEYVALQYGKTYKVDEINNSFSSYVNQEFFKSTQVAETGDTVLISTSETLKDLGHSSFYARQDIGLIGGEQFLLKPNREKTLGKYLYYTTKAFSCYLQKYATGTKVLRFNVDDLKKIYIPNLSLAEQNEVAIFLDHQTTKIDNLITKQKTLIEKLKEYRASVISHAVTGKIDVREWVA